MEVTKRIEFDYGHRVPSHKSKCRNLHGHRAVVEITLEGAVNSIKGNSDDGMVLDFSDIKNLANELIVDKWDHAFLVFKGDVSVVEFLNSLEPKHKTVELDCIPTAENLAQVIFRELSTAYQIRFGGGLILTRVRFYETPNSWADATMNYERSR